MTTMSFMVLYPPPADVDQFERDYQAHLELLHKKLGIPSDERPYTVTKMLDGPTGPATFYQLFSMDFADSDQLHEVLSSSAMQQVAADANRISTGGAPVVLVGQPEVMASAQGGQ
ncbi:EthD family reductase [Marinicella sediminis]|uniref:EthD family reductase n=1 Tax=Marinicella sediminis TaxID=1792834 RepID=A0ABV7J686_9GAMM|nr:EthD family reductase [Marinicella sediminis]